MVNSKDDLAVYNNPIDFKIKFIASKFKKIYKTFIIEEQLSKALTFNLKNSSIKADGELIIGNFKYDDTDKSLSIEIDNPSINKDIEVEVIIATNITNLSYIIENDYVITNVAYIKIKGYENIKELITKSNLITKRFDGVNIDIKAKPVNEIIPAVNGKKIKLISSFNTLDTDVDYIITVKNNIGENLYFDEDESFVLANDERIEFIKFEEVNNTIIININNCYETRNKKIEIIICAKIKNAESIDDVLINEYFLSVNDVECSKDSIQIQFIKPISSLNNSLLNEN